MPCFCKHTCLARITPTSQLAVRSVPPQLQRLLALLELEPVDVRKDEQLSEALPSGGPSWINGALLAQAEGMSIPDVLPPAGGTMMIAMLRLSAAATIFSLQDPPQLLAAVRQAAASLAENLAPQMRSLRAFQSQGLTNMAIAARLTLALRAKGICPTTLTDVDVRSEFAPSAPRVEAALHTAANLAGARVQPFKLSAPQLALAQQLAGMAFLSDAATISGLPSLNDPRLITSLKAQLEALAAMPVPPLVMPPEEIALISDLDAILDAFGEDALTPEGVARVNALLNAVAKMKVRLPAEAVDLSAQLQVTPDLPHVLKGLDAVRNSGAAIAASASTSASTAALVPPILYQMERMAALAEVLEKALGKSAFGLCNACLFPTEGPSGYSVQHDTGQSTPSS